MSAAEGTMHAGEGEKSHVSLVGLWIAASFVGVAGVLFWLSVSARTGNRADGRMLILGAWPAAELALPAILTLSIAACVAVFAVRPRNLGLSLVVILMRIVAIVAVSLVAFVFLLNAGSRYRTTIVSAGCDTGYVAIEPEFSFGGRHLIYSMDGTWGTPVESIARDDGASSFRSGRFTAEKVGEFVRVSYQFNAQKKFVSLPIRHDIRLRCGYPTPASSERGPSHTAAEAQAQTDEMIARSLAVISRPIVGEDGAVIEPKSQRTGTTECPNHGQIKYAYNIKFRPAEGEDVRTAILDVWFRAGYLSRNDGGVDVKYSTGAAVAQMSISETATGDRIVSVSIESACVLAPER